MLLGVDFRLVCYGDGDDEVWVRDRPAQLTSELGVSVARIA